MTEDGDIEGSPAEKQEIPKTNELKEVLEEINKLPADQRKAIIRGSIGVSRRRVSITAP